MKRSRFDPDNQIGAVNVTVKKISGKMSWTEHESRQKADDEIERGNGGYYKEGGREWRFRYRVNVYRKEAA